LLMRFSSCRASGGGPAGASSRKGCAASGAEHLDGPMHPGRHVDTERAALHAGRALRAVGCLLREGAVCGTGVRVGMMLRRVQQLDQTSDVDLLGAGEAVVAVDAPALELPQGVNVDGAEILLLLARVEVRQGSFQLLGVRLGRTGITL